MATAAFARTCTCLPLKHKRADGLGGGGGGRPREEGGVTAQYLIDSDEYTTMLGAAGNMHRYKTYTHHVLVFQLQLSTR